MGSYTKTQKIAFYTWLSLHTVGSGVSIAFGSYFINKMISDFVFSEVLMLIPILYAAYEMFIRAAMGWASILLPGSLNSNEQAESKKE
jgi:hypothetical protein